MFVPVPPKSDGDLAAQRAARPPAFDPETERELRAFVGPNADYYLRRWGASRPGEVESSGFNFLAFLLTTPWLGYRKMYSVAAVWVATMMAVMLVLHLVFVGLFHFRRVPGLSESVSVFVASAIVGMRANGWYLALAREAVADMRSQVPEGEERLKVLADRGGASVVSSAGLTSLMVIVLVAFYYAINGWPQNRPPWV